jgi:hypothetical protein
MFTITLTTETCDSKREGINVNVKNHHITQQSLSTMEVSFLKTAATGRPRLNGKFRDKETTAAVNTHEELIPKVHYRINLKIKQNNMSPQAYLHTTDIKYKNMSQKYALQCSKCYYSAHPQQMWIS